MSIISLIIVTALGLFLVIALTFLSLVITHGLKQGIVFHQALAEQVQKVRLHRMLDRLGIDLSRYVYNHPVCDIEEQIRICNTCKNTSECDKKLQDQKTPLTNLSFCPNQESLQAFSASQQLALTQNS